MSDGTGSGTKAPDAAGDRRHSRPWIAHYPPAVRWDADLNIVPVADQVLAACKAHAERPALDFFGASTSYRQLADTIERLTGALQAELGVRKGSRVALMLPNTPYYVYLYYAVLRAGGTVVNCNPLYSVAELRHIIEDSEAEIIVTLDLKALFGKADQLVAETGLKRLVVCNFTAALPGIKSALFGVFRRREIADLAAARSKDAMLTFRQLMAKARTPTPVDIDPARDVAVQQYTGGTTGIPKGAMLSHANIAANLAQIDAWSDHEYQPGQGLVAVLPFFHIFSMTTCLNNTLTRGMELLMLPRFEMKPFLDLITRKRPEHLMAVPTLLSAVAAHSLTKTYDLTSIRYCIIGGAAANEATREAFVKLSGATMVEGYGLTEASPVVTCQPFRGGARPGSVGQPFPGTDIRIASVDDPLAEVPLGERGEIHVRGPQVMLGYFRDENATREAFAGGWLRTGDVGYLDETGTLFLVDRIKDLIISSGYNIYPRTIEDALYRHPDVEEANVIGVPDEKRGEAPVAYVKLRAGATADRQALLRYLHSELSRLNMPRDVVLRDELPKTLVGKLSKAELREDYARTAGA